MKKTFKMLLLFVFMFLVVLKVDAKEKFQEEWIKSYNYNDNNSDFWDVIVLKDGSIGVGKRCYGDDYIYGGMIAKYDLTGNLVWKIENDENYYLKISDVGDGFVVLTQVYLEEELDYFGYVLLQKYNYDGTKIWEKEIAKEEIGYDLIQLVSLDSLNDKIVLSFNNSVFVFDIEGNLLKQLSVEDLLLPSATIGNDGIYVVGINANTADTVLTKYNLSSLEKELSKSVYKGSIDENDDIIDMSLTLDIEYVKGNIVISSYDSSEKSSLSIYDNNFELLKKNEVDSIVFEIQRYKDKFITVGREHDNNPRGIAVDLLNYINNLEEFKFDIDDAKSRESVIFHINIFDLNLEQQWTLVLEDFYMNSVDVLNDIVIVAGSEYYDNASLIKFVKPILAFEWSIASDSNNVEYYYDIAYHKNGYIAVGWSENNVPCGVMDAKGQPMYYGKIVSYDDNGKELWSRQLSYDSQIFKVATLDNGFLILINDYENNRLLLTYCSYDGEVIWEEVFLDYTINEYKFSDFKLDGYGNYFAFAFDYFGVVGEILEGSNEVKVVDAFLEHYDTTGKYAFFDMTMNDNGIFLVYGNDSNGDIVVQKYDSNMNFVEEKVIINEAYEAPYDINQYGDKIYLLFKNNVYILNNNLSFFREVELSHHNYFDIIGSEDGFDILGAVPCEESAPGAQCGNTGFIMNYNIETEKISYVALDYLPYGSDNANGDLVVAGYGFDQYGNEMIAYAEKYSYFRYNVEVTTDGNGSITSNKVLGTTGEEIEFSVEPKDGYVLKRVVVTTASGEVVEFSDYKFTMPSEDVEIYAEFELLPSNPNTGLSNPIVIFSGILAIALVGSLVVKKKKFI